MSYFHCLTPIALVGFAIVYANFVVVGKIDKRMFALKHVSNERKVFKDLKIQFL